MNDLQQSGLYHLWKLGKFEVDTTVYTGDKRGVTGLVVPGDYDMYITEAKLDPPKKKKRSAALLLQATSTSVLSPSYISLTLFVP